MRRRSGPNTSGRCAEGRAPWTPTRLTLVLAAARYPFEADGRRREPVAAPYAMHAEGVWWRWSPGDRRDAWSRSTALRVRDAINERSRSAVVLRSGVWWARGWMSGWVRLTAEGVGFPRDAGRGDRGADGYHEWSLRRCLHRGSTRWSCVSVRSGCTGPPSRIPCSAAWPIFSESPVASRAHRRSAKEPWNSARSSSGVDVADA